LSYGEAIVLAYGAKKILSGSAMTALLILIVFLNGCSRKNPGDDHLLQVGGQSISVSEFRRDVEAAAEEAFPGEREPDPDALNDLRVRVLNQLTEELIICEYASTLGLQVSDTELQKAVAAIKADYPDKTFEETLLENAVSFQVWQHKLARRLLVEKTIAKELVDRVEITSEDVAQYYKTHYPQGPTADQTEADINKKIITHLRQQKAERMYQTWIDALHKTYAVSVNQKLWDSMVAVKN
jgi:FKBP-type peptidyl-prolyl cis-trans isomerase (trigger factor)